MDVRGRIREKRKDVEVWIVYDISKGLVWLVYELWIEIDPSQLGLTVWIEGAFINAPSFIN